MRITIGKSLMKCVLSQFPLIWFCRRYGSLEACKTAPTLAVKPAPIPSKIPSQFSVPFDLLQRLLGKGLFLPCPSVGLPW